MLNDFTGADKIYVACGGELVEIGKEVRRTLQMKLAEFWVREDVYYTYACKSCEQKTDAANIVKPMKEPALLPDSFAGNPCCMRTRRRCRCSKSQTVPPHPICGCTAPVLLTAFQARAGACGADAGGML